MTPNLPRLFTALVAIVTLSFGNSAETFNMSNPAGTNLAYYLPDASPWLQAFLGYFDIVGLWVLFLLILGLTLAVFRGARNYVYYEGLRA